MVAASEGGDTGYLGVTSLYTRGRRPFAGLNRSGMWLPYTEAEHTLMERAAVSAALPFDVGKRVSIPDR